MSPRPVRLFATLAVVALFGSPAAQATWLDDIGYTRLQLTQPGAFPLTNPITVTQVESGTETGPGAGNDFLPDFAHPEFVGKALVNKTGGSGISGHATAVGIDFYGLAGSPLTHADTVNAYHCEYVIDNVGHGWLYSHYLRYGSASAPLVDDGLVQNHSWIILKPEGYTEEQIEGIVADIDQRLDYAVNRDGFVCVVGVNNGSTNPLPVALCHSYNTISVGVTSGNHSFGVTAYDGAGRTKPEIVAPAFFTSNSTPMTASTAGLLVQGLIAAPHSLSGPNLARVTKALLFAGATKEPFATWDRTTARPIDEVFGAGQINALLSHRILAAGRRSPSNSTTVPETGWAATAISGGAQQHYFFDVPAGVASARLSAAMTWHRIVTDSPGPGWVPTSEAPTNLKLELFTATGTTLGALLDTSDSLVDNLEHIYQPALAPGRYALRVTSPSGADNTDYALAWRTSPTVTVAATTPDAQEFGGTAGVFTLTRTGETSSPLLVPFIVGGTAVSGSHYTALPAHAVIPAGAASATVQVVPVSDALAQGDRTVTLTVATDYSLSAGAPAGATVTIHDKPYDAWRFARFTSGQLSDPLVSGDTADPEGDGRGNLLEYALGTEPSLTDAPSNEPAPSVEADHLTLRYVVPTGRDDLTYTPEWTNDLTVAWQSGPAVVETVSTAPVPGGVEHTVRAVATTTDQPLQFLRLRVDR